jgi:hypothetical protein
MDLWPPELQKSLRFTLSGDVPGPYRRLFYPTPPPFLPHAYENNRVTSIKPKMTPKNKRLTARNLSEITGFAPFVFARWS